MCYLAGSEMKSIQHQTMNLPRRAPVMFLQTVMLPHVLMPLFIFEPRYRAMLNHCLENERMFCVALLRPGVEEARAREDFFPMAGLGLIRACVGHPDGTSHLVLQGMARVELCTFTQELPFRIAELREIPTQAAEGANVEALVKKLRHTCDQFIPGDGDDRRKLKEQIAQVTDAGMLCDMVAHTFLQNAYTQQEVLESLAVEERLRLVETHLRQEMSQ